MPPIKKVPTQVSKPVGGYSVKRLQADRYLAVDKADLEEMIDDLLQQVSELPDLDDVGGTLSYSDEDGEQSRQAYRLLDEYSLQRAYMLKLVEKLRFKRALLAGR